MCRVIENLQYIHEENPATHILVVGLLPRGFWQNPKDMFKLPSAFSRAITAVNHALESYAFETEHIHYTDCTKPFVQTGNVSVCNQQPLLYSVSIDCQEYGRTQTADQCFCLQPMQAYGQCVKLVVHQVHGSRGVHAAKDKHSHCHSRVSQER